jgi:hypothetical protein
MNTPLYRTALALMALWFILPRLYGQTIFFSNLSGQIYSLNISTCATSFVTSATAYNDMAVGTGTTYYGLFGNNVYSINASTGTSTLIATVSNPIVTGLEVGPTGTIYVLGSNLFAINPSTGVVTTVGSLPNGWVSAGDMVYLDGQFYATVYQPSGPDLLINVNINNPALSTVVNSSLPGFLVAGAGVNNPNCPKMYWFEFLGMSSLIWEYDVNSQTWTQVCPGFSFPVGGAGTPSGYSFAINCSVCTTDAGSIDPGPLPFCVADPAVIPFNNDATLDANDLLQFILFSNPANPTGSLLATSNTPSFAYNAAAFTPGQTYYAATIAGNNVSGNVDLSDPCFDISNAVPVVWHPKPAVSFSGPSGPFCAGECITLGVNFSGTPPFLLDATVNFSGTPLSNITQTFNSSTGNVTVCLPATLPNGAISVQATALTDAFCTCN